MRVVRFVAGDGGPRVGVQAADGVVDVSEHLPAVVGDALIALLASDDPAGGLSDAESAARAAGVAPVALDGLQLLGPLAPPTILCTGQNYVAHVKEKPGFPFSWNGPAHFLKLPQTVVGHGAVVPYPYGVSDKLDYEGELAFVIGRGGRHIAPENAWEHVAAYTVINDMALRDWQVRLLENGASSVSLLGVAKNFDSGCPLGPCLVTPDEITDPHALRVQTIVNGIVRMDDNTANFVLDIPQMVAFFSRFLTLEPGTVIATGACGGTAWGMDHDLGGTWPLPEGVTDPYLRTGDHVDCVVEGIGTLSNTIG
jgi:2-keto-4-pentenoate hydratase/2-oxohepta-3-ene-1,7-dioic acid hydratase in catechol pathway